MNDTDWMRRALTLARDAGENGEVPVGAVVVREGEMLGEAGNHVLASCNPCGHAEVLALQRAAKHVDQERLDGATLYVTLEPCLMCCGALLNARIKRLVYGAREPRTGAVVSEFETLIPAARRQHHVAIEEGILAAESAALLADFFARRR